jgi:hypothetical protein
VTPSEFEAKKKPLVERQGLLTNLANATAWMAAVEKKLADWDPAGKRSSPELTELEEAVTEYRDLYQKLYGLHRAAGPTGKSKVGRPSIWRGPEGFYFFCAVTKARKTKPRSIAGAIQWVIKTDPMLKDWSRFSAAALQVRYQEAAKHWSWVLKPEQHQAMQAALDVSLNRVLAALDAFRPWGLSVRKSDFP